MQERKVVIRRLKRSSLERIDKKARDIRLSGYLNEVTKAKDQPNDRYGVRQ